MTDPGSRPLLTSRLALVRRIGAEVDKTRERLASEQVDEVLHPFLRLNDGRCQRLIIDHVEAAAVRFIGRAVPPAIRPDPALTDRLPRTMGDTASRLGVASALTTLQELRSQLGATVAVLERRERIADRARRTALRAAYSRF